MLTVSLLLYYGQQALLTLDHVSVSAAKFLLLLLPSQRERDPGTQRKSRSFV